LQETKKQLERRKLEEALQRSEKHFRSLIENALDIILILGRDGSIRYGSPSIERVLGYVPEDFLNKNVFEFVHPDDVPKLSGIFARGIQIPDYIVSVEFRVRHKNGSWYFGEGIGRNLLHDPAVKGVIVNFRDITERKQAEEKLNHLLEILRKAKEEWEMTFDNVMELIVIIDKDLRIIRCNKSFAEFAGMPINELTGKKCYDFFSCDYKQIGNCRVRSQTEEIARKNEIKTESGRWFYESNCPILDEKRNFLYSVVVATDITELKTSQQGFIQAQEELKNRIKELEDFYDMAVGREMRMIELKNEIEDLKAELSKHKKDELV
jgi:PAS domain S-box-containing protein